MEHAAAEALGWLLALEQSGLGRAMRTSMWLYPTVETLHILGFALLVGSIVTFDARVVVGSRHLDPRVWERLVLPVTRAGFALAVPMGLLLFVTEATAYVTNPAFRLKLLLLVAALANIAVYHTLSRRAAGLTGTMRVAAAASLVLWIAVLACGRLIAYV